MNDGLTHHMLDCLEAIVDAPGGTMLYTVAGFAADRATATYFSSKTMGALERRRLVAITGKRHKRLATVTLAGRDLAAKLAGEPA